MAFIDSYLANVYWVCKYYKSDEAPSKCKQVIRTDILKCMMIGSCCNSLLLFTKGRTHYLKYLRWICYGSIFGLGYSFYFTSQKVDSFLIRREMGLDEE